MKSTTFPFIRVDPELRQTVEKVLRDGETLSGFVEQSIQEQVQRRNLRQQFIDRGLRSGESATNSGEYYTTEQVLTELDDVLTKACQNHIK